MAALQALTLAVVMVGACVEVLPVFGEAPNSTTGWVQFNSHSYLVQEQALAWSDAWDHCYELGAHLLILDTTEEAEFVQDVMNVYGITYLHAGLHDLFKTGKYVTILGQPMASTSFKWADGEPDKLDEHCALFNHGGTVADIYCDNRMYQYICETL